MFLSLALGVPPALPTDSAKAENNVYIYHLNSNYKSESVYMMKK